MAATDVAPSTGRIAYIDGLRAVAVLLVVIHHATTHYPGSSAFPPLFSPRYFFYEGAHGVDLFFVLSGFCLSYPILRKLRDLGVAEFDVYRYFAKRIVRIVPPYYLAIALLAFSGLAMYPFGIVDIIKQALFWDRDTTFLNGSFWTLAVEFRWYLFFPVALLLWARAPRAFLALACATTLAYNLTILHGTRDVATLLPFMLGIVAADLELNSPERSRWIAAFIPVALVAGLFGELSFSRPFYLQVNPGMQVAAFCFVVASAAWPPLRRALSWPPMVATGTASYSIYLVHEPILVFAYAHWPPGPALVAAAITISIAAGFVFWFLWERLWMYGPLKNHAVAIVERACTFAGTRLQIPHLFALK